MVSNARYALGGGDDCESVAITESTISNVRHALRDGNGSEAVATIESAFSNARHTFGDSDGSEAAAAREHPTFNARQTLWDCDGDEVVATFYFKIGKEPCYRVIYGGEWLDDEPYAAIHRIAVKYPGRRIADECFDYCKSQFDSIKIDTHRDNIPMQRCLARQGFVYCGIIHLENGEERLAYQYKK